MGNLGQYQTMTTLAKKLGGPAKLAAAIAICGFALLRTGEGAAKWAARKIGNRTAPCTTKGRTFEASSVGNDGGLEISIGDRFRVLECDGNAVLIEVLDNPENPYCVSSAFLASISDYPANDTEALQ